MNISQLDIIADFAALIVVLIIGLFWNPDMRRLMGFKQKPEEPDEGEKEETE